MYRKKLSKFVGIFCVSLSFTACLPPLARKEANKALPESYSMIKDSANVKDTTNTANVNWKVFFTDLYLTALIDTALKNNQELNIIMQEINIAKNEVRFRKGLYLPFINLLGIGGVEKTARYTRLGAIDANTDIEPGKQIPNPLGDFLLGANISWQVDIWKQLRNAKKAAIYRYLSTVEGKNYMVTRLVAEIAYAYYELLALDNQLEIVKTNIEIQQNALHIVTLQKTAGQVTELAVLRFQAEVRKNQSRQYYIEQRIIETQNMINFLVGRYSRPTQRNSQGFTELVLDTVYAGIPVQLLENRRDVKQAELELTAAKLDVKVAKASFYPALNIVAGVGFEAFNAQHLITTPQSILWNIAGGLAAPLVNRNGIKATYLSANARQIRAAYNFERTILKANTEVANQQSNVINLAKSYEAKAQQVDALTRSINISISLFKSARADYVEVLLTQREALDAKIELIETKKQQLNAKVKMYQVLGGGWK